MLPLEKTKGAIKKGQSRETDNIGTQDEENKTEIQHNMCLTPLYRNKHR